MSLVSRFAAWKFKLPPAKTYSAALQQNIPIPMPDGVILLANRYYPTNTSQPPLILVRSPYGRAGLVFEMFARPLAERGFQVLVQSCRGTFGSGGKFYPFHHERADGLATIAWLKEQAWYPGTFAMFGPSYLSYVQWAVADSAGPDLKALIPIVTTSEFRSVTYPGETFALDTVLSWAQGVIFQETPPLRLLLMRFNLTRKLNKALMHLPLCQTDRIASGQSVDFYQDWLTHNTPGDPYWEQSDHLANISKVSAPVHLIGGFYDVLFPHTLECYRRLRAAGQNPYLTVGPWTHGAAAMQPVMLNEALQWCRAHLLNDPSHLRQLPVRLYVMGAEEWRDFETFPPTGYSPQRWHLQPGGGLSPSLPSTSAPDHYRYDPADPTPSLGGSSLTSNSGPKDNRKLETRPDVLVFSSHPLEQDIEVIGPVCAELYVRSNRAHTDFFVRLCDVFPSGKSINLSDGILRLAPGNPAPSADGVLKIEIELWHTANRFKKGHRIRLQVSSGAHPRFARNPGSGEPLSTAVNLLIAEQQIFHDPAHPSAIILSVKE